MSFLISDAIASTATTQPGDGIYSFVMMGAIFVLFYFMLIRPQNQKAKAQKTLLASLNKGDEVVLMGGVLGKITSIEESYLKLQISEGCEILVQRQAVNAVLPKGTLKSL